MPHRTRSASRIEADREAGLNDYARGLSRPIRLSSLRLLRVGWGRVTLLRDVARRAAGYLPARSELLLRVARSRRGLGGFYAPGQELSALVPKGKIAIDAGANVGVYSY